MSVRVQRRQKTCVTEMLITLSDAKAARGPGRRTAVCTAPSMHLAVLAVRINQRDAAVAKTIENVTGWRWRRFGRTQTYGRQRPNELIRLRAYSMRLRPTAKQETRRGPEWSKVTHDSLDGGATRAGRVSRRMPLSRRKLSRGQDDDAEAIPFLS
jgi:hypothetical protein